MVKICENTYRLVNISLINELALVAGKMDINIWEVIEAAKSKPFGFQAFYPDPGIGGHCIPLDPFYLEHIAKRFDVDLSMIHTAGHINMRMPHYMAVKITSALNRHKKSINGSKVLFLGLLTNLILMKKGNRQLWKLWILLPKKEVLYRITIPISQSYRHTTGYPETNTIIQ